MLDLQFRRYHLLHPYQGAVVDVIVLKIQDLQAGCVCSSDQSFS